MSGASRETLKAASKVVRPLMSTDFCEARRNVMRLYRAAFRFIPCVVKYYDIPKSERQVHCKLREMFYQNACVNDIRVIDLLVIKGKMELDEVRHTWQQKGHVMDNWHPTAEPKPYTFIAKFLTGVDT